MWVTGDSKTKIRVFIFMKPRYTSQEFDLSKSTDKLPCECYGCGETFHKEKKYITTFLNGSKSNTIQYCSKKCKGSIENKSVDVVCVYCGKLFTKQNKEIKKSKSGNHFCSKTCAATYNNTHKKHGTRISKLEIWLNDRLSKLYPDLEMHFNHKDAINSELDIYIPSLKLAFELNGIFHYEPIYGEDKLQRIQNNDNRKFQACLEHGIELCIIDTSQQKYFKEKTSQKYLNIIERLINEVRKAGFEPA